MKNKNTALALLGGYALYQTNQNRQVILPGMECDQKLQEKNLKLKKNISALKNLVVEQAFTIEAQKKKAQKKKIKDYYCRVKNPNDKGGCPLKRYSAPCRDSCNPETEYTLISVPADIAGNLENYITKPLPYPVDKFRAVPDDKAGNTD
ncbi:hypothetical protein CPAV1605_167 [seawater metagenome]|uniref:Uncharacterized protein n=1 Tax=seawater metagenome TaxID=1561972 RepID=A0A5E8CKW2_9ZZZZ